MPVGVNRDLDETVAHLFLHVGEGRPVLNQLRAEGVPQAMEAEFPQAGLFECGLHVGHDDLVPFDPSVGDWTASSP